ncbi:MAG TPA: hypothetical protein VFQ53_16425 [Kofleriaceae bacterium]|nr:hypothetical protein [Kofleriaceae bacterium]
MDIALDSPFQTLTTVDLDLVSGGKFDVNRMVDSGNRWGQAGAAIGGGVGLIAGAPGGPPGMATGAGIGAAIGGAGGWIGGAAGDAVNQLRGR